jgi:anthranilate synthase/aminodeoxychorismate synthase-like glutamine amidotransferase
MIVLLDNRDSFACNLARHLSLLGPRVAVVPSHRVGVAELVRLRPQALVISPGPCTPTEAGCSLDAVRALAGSVPILGVCLGHQVIAAAAGARIVRARAPVHGRTSRVRHDGVNLFAGIPDPMTACRYHSLVVAPGTLPPELVAVAHDDEGTIMAIADERRRIYGVQFHPESILTRHGFRLLANFLAHAGVPHAGGLAALLDDDITRQAEAAAEEPPPPDRIVTF